MRSFQLRAAVSGANLPVMLIMIGAVATNLLVIIGIAWSLLGNNIYFLNRMIERATEKTNAAKMKDEKELLGKRMYIAREAKRAVRVNFYEPDTDGPHPAVFLAHGGNFLDGDADDLDEFCNRMRNMWNVSIINISYTKLPVHRTTYPQEEIQDVIDWFNDHAGAMNLKKDNFIILGIEAGAYLSLQGGISAIQHTHIADGYIFLDPFTDYVATSFARIGQHPGPVAIVTSGMSKEAELTKAYVSELEEHGVATSFKDFPVEEKYFYLKNPNELSEWKQTSQERALVFISEKVKQFLNRK